MPARRPPSAVGREATFPPRTIELYTYNCMVHLYGLYVYSSMVV